jgi:hypothetical protein
VRQIDFDDWGGGLFPQPALSGRNSRHLSLYPVNRSGADAKRFGRFEDARAGRQLLPDALNDIGVLGAYAESLSLCSDARGSKSHKPYYLRGSRWHCEPRKARSAKRSLMRSVPDGEELYEILLRLGDSTDSERAHDRTAAIIGAAFLEHALKHAICRHLKEIPEDPNFDGLFDGDEAPLRDFSARIKLAEGLGIVDRATRNDLDIIRHIRNAFAHTKARIGFDTKAISDFCDDFSELSINDSVAFMFGDKSLTQTIIGNRRHFTITVAFIFWRLTIYSLDPQSPSDLTASPPGTRFPLR